MKHTWWQRGETVVDTLALFRAHQALELKKIRREIRRLERIQAWRRFKRWLKLA
jgi:hypothetical protein